MITVQQVALQLLGYIGVTQLTPQPAGSELESVTNGDLDTVALAITGAMQEIHATQPLENMEKAAGGALHAPAQVTLNVINLSTTIAGFGAYAAWMSGGTFRITGDDQDNQLISATELARPYMGPTATGVAATIYGDCYTLPANFSRAIAPIYLPNTIPMPIVDTLGEFLALAGWPIVTGLDGRARWSPFFFYIRKSVARPLICLAEGAYDGTLAHVPRRLRFAPLPDQAYPIAFRAAVNAPRYTRADIVSPLVTLTVTGAGTGAANQNYTYLCDVGDYRMFRGVSTAAWSIYYHPTLATFILCATLNVAATPGAYWSSDLVTSPLGTFTPQGTATGTVTVTTSDTGGGIADPGTVIPIVDEAVELVLIPLALQIFTTSPSFKNESAKPGILKRYNTARDKLLNSRVVGASKEAGYR